MSPSQGPSCPAGWCCHVPIIFLLAIFRCRYSCDGPLSDCQNHVCKQAVSVGWSQADFNDLLVEKSNSQGLLFRVGPTGSTQMSNATQSIRDLAPIHRNLRQLTGRICKCQCQCQCQCQCGPDRNQKQSSMVSFDLLKYRNESNHSLYSFSFPAKVTFSTVSLPDSARDSVHLIARRRDIIIVGWRDRDFRLP